MDIPLQCSCGKLQGKLLNASPTTSNRLVCMCDDCQTFAHYLERQDTVLDPNGGTDIFQTTPSAVTILTGHEHLQCVKLSPKGLMRWYAACCNTPIANTMALAKVPFAGVVHACIDVEAHRQTLGPIRARVQGRFGHGTLPEGSYDKAPIGLIFRMVWLMARGWIGRHHKPSPFFDKNTGNPVVQPTILTREERETLRLSLGS